MLTTYTFRFQIASELIKLEIAAKKRQDKKRSIEFRESDITASDDNGVYAKDFCVKRKRPMMQRKKKN